MGIFSIFKKKSLKGNVAFIGLGYAGKTTILHRLRNDEFIDDSIRTMGLNVDAFDYNGVKFSAFDLGGQETFRMIWEPYVRNATAVIYVIDSSTPDLFPEGAKALHEVLQYIPEKAILMLLANKSDLAGPNTLNDIIQAYDFVKLQESANLKSINIFHISTKTGDQFEDAFDWLADSVVRSLKASS